MDLSFPLGKINRFFRHLCTLVNDHQDVVLQGEWGEQSSVHGGPRLPAYAGSTPAEGPETNSSPAEGENWGKRWEESVSLLTLLYFVKLNYVKRKKVF